MDRTKRTSPANMPEYRAWNHAIHRCFDPSDPGFTRYGGRGITMCDRWRTSYAAFLADMGRRPSPAHSIERINNDGDYEPGNCRWATRKEQCRNRVQNIFVVFDGQRMCLLDACEASGKSYDRTKRRIKGGEPPQSAFDRPADVVKSYAGRIGGLAKARAA